MSNELIWIGMAIINFGLIILCYYLFGRIGIFAWIAMGTVLANIQVMKTIEIFGITATLGNIMYGTVFLAGDILNEKYGAKTARSAVFVGFFINLSSVMIMQIALLFQGTTDSALMNDSLNNIFRVMPIIFLASLVAYIISQLIDIAIFQKIKNRFPSKKMIWLRKTGSTLIGQAIDSIIFVSIAFGITGTYQGIIFWEVLLTTYLIKAIVALIDTPFIYIIQKVTPLNEKNIIEN